VRGTCVEPTIATTYKRECSTCSSPAALGARTVLLDDGLTTTRQKGPCPPEDIEGRCAPQLVDMLSDKTPTWPTSMSGWRR